ncbi:MAG: heavy-metal-associated domain-containing protein [Flavobacteriia bacterium]|nr:heavy-metal-associated domain-containing protein [Flavobacteriia bacterium]
MEIFVENIKCAGCMNTIKKSIKEIVGEKNIEIDLENEKITVDTTEENREKIAKKLYSLGYPEKGNNSFIEKAKSYVSCAIGKVSAKS